MLLHSARVHALSSRVPCVLVLTQSELGDATGQRRQGRSDWVQSQPSPRTNVQPICSTYSNTGIHFSTFNFFFFIEKGHCQNILMCWHTALKLLWLYCLVLCFIHHTEHFLLLQFSKKCFPYLIDMCCCIDKESCKLKWKKAFFVPSNLHFCPVLYFHSVCLVSRYACGVGWTVQKGLLYYSCESLCFFSSFG